MIEDKYIGLALAFSSSGLIGYVLLPPRKHRAIARFLPPRHPVVCCPQRNPCWPETLVAVAETCSCPKLGRVADTVAQLELYHYKEGELGSSTAAEGEEVLTKL